MAKATEQVTKSFQGLPIWAKGAIAVAVVGGAAYLIYKLWSFPKQFLDGRGNRQEDRAWNTELEKLGQKPTMSKAQIDALANKAYAAMNGYGTDEDALYEVFRALKNDADFAALQAAYGVRTISSGSWNPAANFEGNLIAAITDEVDANTRKIINNILKVHKINYTI